MYQETKLSMILQRQFEIEGNSFVDKGNSKILYSRGPISLNQEVGLTFASAGVLAIGMGVGGVSGIALGLVAAEVSTGRGLPQSLSADSPYIPATGFLLMLGLIGGALVSNTAWRRWLENRGLMRIPERHFSPT